jgi:hypothetical protein
VGRSAFESAGVAPLIPPGSGGINAWVHLEAAHPELNTAVEQPAHAPPIPASVRRALASPGNAIESGARREMERRFGQDFSRVRIHHGPEAGASTGDLRATAYTAGQSIVFSPNQYSPRTAAGKRLLAHELAHVVQQREAVSILPTIGPIRDASELAAERFAGGATDRPSVASTVPAVQRQPVEPAAPTGLPDKPAGDRATEDEIEAALTGFLNRVQHARGGRGLMKDSPVVWQALHTLTRGDSRATLVIDNFLAGSTSGSPAEFARQARQHLPSRIPRSALDELDKIPSAPSSSGVPGSIGETLDQFVDRTIGPLIKDLTKSKDLQDKLLQAAHAAVTSGVLGMASAAMANLDPKARASFGAAIDAAIKQTQKRAQAPVTSPYVAPPPPATMPWAPPASKGQQIVPSPNLPVPGTPAPATPAPSASAAPPSVAEVIQGLADDALLPPEARGKPAAAALRSARAFAQELTDKLNEAQQKKQGSVELTLSSAFRDVGDTRFVLDEAARITQLIKNALPHRASNVTQVIITIESSDPQKPSFIRRVIQLH